jgi:hypothetical protein
MKSQLNKETRRVRRRFRCVRVRFAVMSGYMMDGGDVVALYVEYVVVDVVRGFEADGVSGVVTGDTVFPSIFWPQLNSFAVDVVFHGFEVGLCRGGVLASEETLCPQLTSPSADLGIHDFEVGIWRDGVLEVLSEDPDSLVHGDSVDGMKDCVVERKWRGGVLVGPPQTLFLRFVDFGFETCVRTGGVDDILPIQLKSLSADLPHGSTSDDVLKDSILLIEEIAASCVFPNVPSPRLPPHTPSLLPNYPGGLSGGVSRI